MSNLVARTGRLQQRYENGCRLVAGKLELELEYGGQVYGAFLCCLLLGRVGCDYNGEDDYGDLADAIEDLEALKEVLERKKNTLKEKGEAYGCIPFRYRDSDLDSNGGNSKQVVEVLMITSTSGPGLLFPKGGWENDETVKEAAAREAIEEAGVRGEIMEFLGHYDFKSKTHQDEFSPEGLCKAAMFALFVKEELDSWPEQSTRNRKWLTIPEAKENCRHAWMRKVLEEGFCKWHDDNKNIGLEEDDPITLDE